MNKEKYNQIIDEAYKNYQNKRSFANKDNVRVPHTLPNGMTGQISRLFAKEEFINKCKIDTEFSEKWGLKIEERELSLEERVSIFNSKMISEDIRTQIATVGVDETYWKSSLEKTKHIIPTKLITLTYNTETIESYE